MLNRYEVIKILNAEPIIDEWPWNTKNEGEINDYYKNIIKEIEIALSLESTIEYEEFYVDAWLFRDDDTFRFATSRNYFYGLKILFSRFSKYYVLGEGTKSWDADRAHAGGTGISSEFVDKINRKEVKALLVDVNKILTKNNFIRLHKEDTDRKIELEWEDHSRNINPEKIFDVLFYFED